MGYFLVSLSMTYFITVILLILDNSSGVDVGGPESEGSKC